MASAVDTSIPHKKLERDFSEVIIGLDNITLPDHKLFPTPSMFDNLTYEQERDLRIYGCELIQTAGNLLQLPQVAMATGQVLFQRFYYCKSIVKHNVEVVSMACINLASKIEEAPRRVRDVINVYHHMKQIRNKKTISPLSLDEHYSNLKKQVINSERRILKELGFCVHVKHPHKMIVMYLQVLNCEHNQGLVQYAWNLMNDSFRTNVFTRYHPEIIACACIYLAARQLKVPLPSAPAWWLLMGAKEEQLVDISRSILELYQRKKPNIEELERVVNELKKGQLDARMKAKEARILREECSQNATPETPATKVTSPVVVKEEEEEEEEKVEEERPTLTLGEEIIRHSKKRKLRSRSKSPKDRGSTSPDSHRRHRHRHHRHRSQERHDRRLSERGRRERHKTSHKEAYNRHHSASNLKRFIEDKEIDLLSSPASHDSKASALTNGDEKEYLKTIVLDNGSNHSSHHSSSHSSHHDDDHHSYRSKHRKQKRHKKRSKLTPSPTSYASFKKKYLSSRC